MPARIETGGHLGRDAAELDEQIAELEEGARRASAQLADAVRALLPLLEVRA